MCICCFRQLTRIEGISNEIIQYRKKGYDNFPKGAIVEDIIVNYDN